MTTVGRRIPDPGNEWAADQGPQPGDYWQDADGLWSCRPPWKHAWGNLAKHHVTEHEDGTITVTPSILITTQVGTWHGYLERGIWREC